MRRTSVSSSKMVAFVVAALVLGTTATASAAPKKDSAARSSSTTMCNGTPVIMQGLDCPQRPARGAAREQATERTKYPRITAPGSSSYVAPLASRPPSLIPQPSVTPYVPAPISNPSERITQFNHSFPLNGGLGLNPTDRDSYIRYNFNR
jgi:hypothetical protein